MIDTVFLGTGNYLAPGRYWNSFVIDGTVLVEPSPTALPNLRRAGLHVRELNVVAISHFHPDHTFGWPFLLLEFIESGRQEPLFVVGPPDVRAFLNEMLELGGVQNVRRAAEAMLDIRYLEVDMTWQEAGALRFRAVEVEHVEHLRCFGYLFERGERVIAYSGDTRPCPGLDELAAAADVLVVECNSAHPVEPPLPVAHMDLTAIRALRGRFPGLPLVLIHLGPDVDAGNIPNAVIPSDFDRLTL